MAGRDIEFSPGSVSRDGRTAGDWASQYADIIAAELLPASWPQAIAVDSFEVSVRTTGPSGRPVQKGQQLYSVLGAAGYEGFGRAGQLWHLRAFARTRERDYREFFCELEGRRDVKVVLCDGNSIIRRAAEWAFPHATVYPCAWHLTNTLVVSARRAHMNTAKRALWRALRVREGDLFSGRERWEHFELLLDRYLRAADDRADERIIKGLHDMDAWRTRNRKLVELTLSSPHWPRDLTLLEEHLAAVRDRLGERRRNFRNLPRLNSLLALMLLDLRGQADEAGWARILRAHHLAQHAHVPLGRQARRPG